MTALWWQIGVIYQIYPRSFQDTNGDGIRRPQGDRAAARLSGRALASTPSGSRPSIPRRWPISATTSPTIATSIRASARSPISTLCLREAHARGLKVLLDFVPNHTSDQHPWFVESRSSRDNPKRDWYIWRDPAPDGGPPNNWISDFGGSAWEWDEATGQYYYHAFLKEQPDLNWRNPAVQAAMYDVMRFWFDRGVDGFRIDVLWHMVKAADFPDNPPNPDYQPAMGEMHRVLQLHSTDQPEVHGIAAEMRAIADSYGAAGRGERVLIGEIYLPVDRLMHYYGRERAGVHLPFNFQLDRCPVGRALPRQADRRLRGRASAGRLAELGARQSRSAARRRQAWAGAGPRRGDAAADTSRHADALLRRRTGLDRRRDSQLAMFRTRASCASLGSP